MSEKHDKSCASQQQKEKKANNSGTKHSKKTHKKRLIIKINLKTLCLKYMQDQSRYEKYNLSLATKII